jgi:hypothetical protein
VKGILIWRSWPHLQVMVLILWEMVLVHLPHAMMRSWNNCLCTWISKKMCFCCVIVVANPFHMFNANELEEGASCQLMDLDVGV